MQQCRPCAFQPIDEFLKPFGDYFLCSCYGKRELIGFGPELEHWNDKYCTYCAEEKNCCRTCGETIPEESIETEKYLCSQWYIFTNNSICCEQPCISLESTEEDN